MVYTVDYEKLLWIYWYILIIWKHIVWHLKYETVDTYGGLRGYINVSKQCVSYIYIYYIYYTYIYIYIMISPKKVESIGIDSPDPQSLGDSAVSWEQNLRFFWKTRDFGKFDTFWIILTHTRLVLGCYGPKPDKDGEYVGEHSQIVNVIHVW